MTALGLGTGLIYPNLMGSKVYVNSESTDFDGSNQYGEIGDHNNFTPTASGFAWSVWFYFESGVDVRQQRIHSKAPTSGSTGFEWQFTIASNSKPRLFLYFGGTASASAQGGRIRFDIDTTVSTGNWYHVVFSWDGGVGTGAITGWLNGSIATHGSGATAGQVGDGTTTVVNDTKPLHVARSINNYGEVYIDEYSLFSTELNNTQVGAIYNSGVPTDLSSHAGLVGYWRMGEDDTGSTITDLSSTSEDMTLYNSPLADTSNFAGV